MRFAFVVAFVTALLWVPLAASAELTPDEGRSLLQLRAATLNLSTGLMDYVALLMNTATTDQTRPIFGAAMQNALLASREANMAIGLLLNVITEQVSTVEFANIAALPRSERVALAWWRCDRAIMYIQSAQRTLAGAKSLNQNDGAYQDAIRRATDIWFLNALTALLSVDRALAYTNPNPSSFPQIVGPHGDFATAEWMLWRSQHYAHDAMDDMVVAYLGTKLNSYAGSADIFRRLLMGSDIDVDAMVLLAGVTWTDQQVQQGVFFRTVDVLRVLTDEEQLPKRWMEAVGTMRDFWLPAMSAGPAVADRVRTALVRVVDAWKHADGAAWRLMIFLDCSKLKNPQGCGGTGAVTGTGPAATTAATGTAAATGTTATTGTAATTATTTTTGTDPTTGIAAKTAAGPAATTGTSKGTHGRGAGMGPVAPNSGRGQRIIILPPERRADSPPLPNR